VAHEEYKDMIIEDFFAAKGIDCAESHEACSYGTTTMDVWENLPIGEYVIHALFFAVQDGLILEDPIMCQNIVNNLIVLHSCVSESERGIFCDLFDDSPQESSVLWCMDWINHITEKHGGRNSAVSLQIANIVRNSVGVNPYA